MQIVEKVIRILKGEIPATSDGQSLGNEDGSVTQRFCIAILQKMSVKESVIEVLVQRGMIIWSLRLLEKSRTG